MRIKIHEELYEKMEKTMSVLNEELHSVRAGRANPSLLDRITVDYYGMETPLKQMANISAPEPRLLMIQPYDTTVIKDIEKAILVSDLGINPSNDGKVIRLNLPILTEETRKELTKVVKKLGEEAKVAIRNERRHANDALKKMQKAGEITEDDLTHFEKEVQKMTDNHTHTVDDMIKDKEKEILEV